MASQHNSPAHSPAPPPHMPRESAISRLLIAPLTFVSFLLSLALIDSRNNALRTRSHVHSHSPSRPAPSTIYGRVKNFLHGLCYKQVGTSPYAYVRSPDLKVVGDGVGGPAEKGRDGVKGNGGGGGEDERWYWHTKQKKMMKAEFSDAFRIRKWVVLLLGIVIAGAFIVGLVLVGWMVSVARHYWVGRVNLGDVVRGTEGNDGRGVFEGLTGGLLWRDW